MVHRSAISVPRLWIAALTLGLAGMAGMAEAQNGLGVQPQGLNWAGIYALRGVDPSLIGSGVRLGVVCRSYTYQQDEPQGDYRPNAAHSCFQNARLSFYDDGMMPAGISPHETAICSILFGEDPLGIAPNLDPFLYEGILPAAEGHVFELRHFVTRYVYAQEAPAVDVLAASFGMPLDAWWTRGMESLVEHQGLPIVASIGNGSNASDPPLYPGAGANTIGVGVVSSVSAEDLATSLAYFALAYPEQSSRGPTENGRCKPDLIAPGNCLVASAAGDQDYEVSGTWSSFATPITAGVAGLLVQTARQDRRLAGLVSPEGGNCALKAILMTSATKLPFWHKGRLTTEDDHESPLDYAQGAGMVNAVRAHQVLVAGRAGPGIVAPTGWDLNQVGGNQAQQVYRMVVSEPANRMLTATLTWNRHYDRQYPFTRISERDTDLRLEVWAIDPRGPGNDLLLDYSDSKVDNVEHVHIELTGSYTSYAIVVSYGDADDRVGPPASERYGIAWDVNEKPAGEDILWHDLNADGIVDERDLEILKSNVIVGQTSPDAYVIGDVNMDGVIDGEDLRQMDAYRNRTAPWRADTLTN
jgi:hypothetical protein